MTASHSAVGQARDSVSFGVRISHAHPATWLLIILGIAFSLWFSAYSIRLHDAHLTHKADLGQMDIAIWNTAHGRILQEIKGDAISTRLTDHVEPIFILIAPVYWLWADVRVLLILQAVSLALGAWPIYLLARRRLGAAGLVTGPWSPAPWGALAFAAAYLLMPAARSAAGQRLSRAAPRGAPDRLGLLDNRTAAVGALRPGSVAVGERSGRHGAADGHVGPVCRREQPSLHVMAHQAVHVMLARLIRKHDPGWECWQGRRSACSAWPGFTSPRS